MPLPRRFATLALVLLLALAACEESATTGSSEPGASGGTSSGLPRVVLTSEEQARYDQLIGNLLGEDGLSGSIARYWFDAYPRMVIGSLYRPPTAVTAYEGNPQPSGCGPLATDNAWYCSTDEALYYDDNLLRTLYRAYGPAAPTIILAHEWGHHIQTVMLAPEVDVQAELQADCLAGMFFGEAFLPPPGEQDLRSAGATLFLLGDRNYSASQWFAPNVHGPASWRAKAFLDGMLGEGAYCVDYRDWEDRGTVSIQNYEWLPAPAVEVTEGDDGSVTATLRGRTALIQGSISTVSETAVEFMPAAIAGYLGTDATPVGSTQEIETGEGVGGILGGTGAVQAFQFTFPDGSVGRGILFVHVATTGDAATVAVYEPGAPPALELTDPSWNPLLNWMFVVGFSLCPPDGAGTMCIALGEE